MLHDNTRQHVDSTVQDMLGSVYWMMSDHPPHSLDLSPCDFHVFGPLKKEMKGLTFMSDGTDEGCGGAVLQE
jgi:hypothetical protein